MTGSGDLRRATTIALMLAVFTVSVGYGVVLPLLPDLIERLLGGGTALISRHTGLLTAIYTLSLFLFAPLWGQLSDRHGPRGVLLFGLLGFGVTMLVFSFVESIAAVYAERFLSGMFAAAVTPVAAAVVAGFATTEQERARRLAFVSMAGIAGFLLGPMLSVFITRFATELFAIARPTGSVAIPLTTTALLALIMAVAIVFVVPSGKSHNLLQKTTSAAVERTTWLVPKLLILTFIVSAGVGVFEVGLALRGKQELGLSPYQIALMFSECSLVMFVMQAIVFSPRFKPDRTRWLIAPALVVLAFGLALVPKAVDFTLMLVVIGAVAASAGILSPILTYWISAKAGSTQGWELGKQTAAASLGVTLGSAAGGLFFDATGLPGASFVLAAGLAAVGVLLSLGLSHLLAPGISKSNLNSVLSSHNESSGFVPSTQDQVFSYIDDYTRLSSHMNEPSWRMAGSRMQTELDEGRGKEIGSRIRLTGRFFGVDVLVDEIVTERSAPHRKVWETTGVPKLLVIGHYRMGFELSPQGDGSMLCVFIDYALPDRAPERWLGRMLGPYYARWCTQQMVIDVVKHFTTSSTLTSE